MILDSYFRSGNMELSKEEVEFAIDTSLKTILRWLLNECSLKDQQESNNIRGLVILITINNKIEAKQFITNSF